MRKALAHGQNQREYLYRFCVSADLEQMSRRFRVIVHQRLVQVGQQPPQNNDLMGQHGATILLKLWGIFLFHCCWFIHMQGITHIPI